MLQDLSIRNFAIIDDLHISFQEGLTILSGETGAGKSIIINAVNLLLGSRATARLVRTGADFAELEAQFDISATSMAAKVMTENGYDPSEGLLIRRIISCNDRHKIFINGRLATMHILGAVTQSLASISGQHAHQGLLKEDLHLDILDQFGGLVPLKKKVQQAFQTILPLIGNLKDLENTRDRQDERRDLLEYQKKEISGAGITPGEDEALEQERLILKNGEALYQDIHGSLELLYDREGAVAEQLGEVEKHLEKAEAIDAALAVQRKEAVDLKFHIEDMAADLRTYLKNIQIDDGQLEAVETRLDALTRLKRKYGGNLETVMARLDAIDRELDGIENIAHRIAAARDALDRQHETLASFALSLSHKRNTTALALAGKVEMELSSLCMAKTIFKIEVSPIMADPHTEPFLSVDGHCITENGLDKAAFMIAPNVGEALKPLSAIASGGELSRVVLALKALLAQNDSVQTVVFDEVDAGIGGAVAEVVGHKLATLAGHHQIICITHLPQIARFGDHHFRISKDVVSGRTRTCIDPLDEAARVDEIARMLGGMKITAKTLAHAREMVEGHRGPP